jgi:MFS family permease
VSWRYLFVINAPIGLAGLVAAIRFLPTTGHRQVRPFDFLGLLLGSGGLSLLVLGLSQANEWGWSSPATVGCLALAVVSIAGFVRHELGIDHPMIQLRMFTDQPFRVAMGVMTFVWMGNFARLVFIPLQLEGLRGVTALRVGTLFFPPAVATAAAMQVGGRLTDRIGPRLPILLGCAVNLASLIGFTRLTLVTPLWVVCVLLAVQGIGFGLVSAPAMVAGLSDLPPDLMAQGTAVRSVVNQMSGALAVASFGAIVAARMGSHPSAAHAQRAYNGAFVAASVGLALSLLLATRLPRRVAAGATGFDDALALATE